MTRLVTIAHFYDLPSAFVAKSYLDQYGFIAFVWDDRTSAINWLQLLAIGGPRISVLEEEAEAAHSILADAGGPHVSIEHSSRYARLQYWILIATNLAALAALGPIWLLANFSSFGP